MKKLLEFELDGQPVYVETEVSETEMRRVSRGNEDEPIKADSRFIDAVAGIRPAAEFMLNAFREMNSPDEINLEFGLNFSAKTGVVFASANTSATFNSTIKFLKVDF